MQTFLPYDSYVLSAHCLDAQRLGKQRVEVLQILNALTGKSAGWKNHPATKMWRGHEAGLSWYGITMCLEWCNRGYDDTCLHKIQALVSPDKNDFPEWFGDERLHDSHKSNLLRKLPEHYKQFNWEVDANLGYYWPP
jgi:hypothetical protein